MPFSDLVHDTVGVHEVAVTLPPSGHEVDLGEAVENHTGDVVGEPRHGEVLPVEDDLVVDLVRDDRDVVLGGDVTDLPQVPLLVDCAGRVVGVDDDDGLGAVGDPPADHVHVGSPVLVLDHTVRDAATLVELDVLLVGGVAGAGDEYLVTGLHHGAHHDVDALGDTGGDVDVLRVDPDAVLLELTVDDGPPEVEVTLGVAVAVVGVVDGLPEGLLEVLRSLEVPLVGVTYVEVVHLDAAGGDGGCGDGDLTDRVVHSHRAPGCLDLSVHR